MSAQSLQAWSTTSHHKQLWLASGRRPFASERSKDHAPSLLAPLEPRPE